MVLSKIAMTIAFFSCLFFSSAHAEPSANWGGKKTGPKWTLIVTKAIQSESNRLLSVVPINIAKFCPNYAAADQSAKRLIWANLFSLLAYYESGYKPAVILQEKFKNSAGNFVISRGLLQLSKESANGYGCNISDELSLHNSEVNLRCSVKIAQRWIVRDKVIWGKGKNNKWLGMARYWSPFRDPAKRHRIGQLLSATDACKIRGSFTTQSR